MVGKPFQKGKSGNPSGRPKEEMKVKELARAHTERAIQVLANALNDEKYAVAAATALLDRGWGKPTQMLGGDPDNPIKTETKLTDERDSVSTLLEEYRPAKQQTDSDPVVH